MHGVRYDGNCLLKAIDTLPPPSRDVSKPLRLPICDVFSSHKLGQVAIGGKVEVGATRSGSKVSPCCYSKHILQYICLCFLYCLSARYLCMVEHHLLCSNYIFCTVFVVLPLFRLNNVVLND